MTEETDEIRQMRILAHSIAGIDKQFIEKSATLRGLRQHLLSLREQARDILKADYHGN